MPEETCKYCNKVIFGFTVEHAKKQMEIHKLTQHADRVRLVEVKR